MTRWKMLVSCVGLAVAMVSCEEMSPSVPMGNERERMTKPDDAEPPEPREPQATCQYSRVTNWW